MATDYTQPDLETIRLPSGRRKLIKALTVTVPAYQEFVIPAGFITDYSSIPAFARIVVRWSKVDVAGVVHDYLYANQFLSRKDSDKIWYIIAISGNGANRVQAKLCYWGLRVGGWAVWSKHAKANSNY